MRRVLGISLIALALLAVQAPAQATFPGGNGKIAFWAVNRGTIGTIKPNGTGRTPIARGGEPRWSPDGHQMVLSNARGSKIFRKHASAHLQTLIKASAIGKHWYVSSPAWSPAGNTIAFCGYRFTRTGEVDKIFTVRVDGSALTDISGANTHDCYPDWSPDGTTIAFDILRHFGERDEIATMTPTGTARAVVASSKRGNDYPSWSPDSSTILFDRIRHGRFDLATVAATGGPITWLTDTPRRWEFGGVWSPNGANVVFPRSIRSSDRSTDDLWVARSDGTSPHRIVDTPRIDELTPDWQAT